MVKKKRPLKRIKPTPPTPGLSAMKAIARSRATSPMVPMPPEVRSSAVAPDHTHSLVIAIYVGHRPPPDDFPIDLQEFEAFMLKYRQVLNVGMIAEIKKDLLKGNALCFGSPNKPAESPFAARTAMAVLSSGRAKGDIARAVLMIKAAKSVLQ